MNVLGSIRSLAAPCSVARLLPAFWGPWGPAAACHLDACFQEPATPPRSCAAAGLHHAQYAQCSEVHLGTLVNTEATTFGQATTSGSACEKADFSERPCKGILLMQGFMPSVGLVISHAMGSLPAKPRTLLRHCTWRPAPSFNAAHQMQAARGLLGVKVRTKPINWQDHNKKKPKRIKMKTPSVAKKRFIVDKDGMMWRMQQGRRHNRSKKRAGRLHALKGLVPLAPYAAAKLRKLGFKRRWWYSEKS